MIKVQRETDVVALAAFVLALGAGIAQLAAWSRGPQIVLLGPERVALYADTAPSGDPIVRIAAPLAYANTAEQYAAILSREEVTMKLAGLASKQEWNAFGTIGRGNDRLLVTSSGLATPQTVSGQSAVSHITLFVPLLRSCDGEQPCQPKGDYISPELLAQNLRPGRQIAFDFESRFFEEKSKRYGCKVLVTENHARRWAAEQALYAKCRKQDG